MKTTIELPEQLFRRAKAAVARRGMTLKQFFTRAAEQELTRLESNEEEATTPSWHDLLEKPTPAELKELEQIDRTIKDEFSAIDADGWK